MLHVRHITRFAAFIWKLGRSDKLLWDKININAEAHSRISRHSHYDLSLGEFRCNAPQRACRAAASPAIHVEGETRRSISGAPRHEHHPLYLSCQRRRSRKCEQQETEFRETACNDVEKLDFDHYV